MYLIPAEYKKNKNPNTNMDIKIPFEYTKILGCVSYNIFS